MYTLLWNLHRLLCLCTIAQVSKNISCWEDKVEKVYCLHLLLLWLLRRMGLANT